MEFSHFLSLFNLKLVWDKVRAAPFRLNSRIECWLANIRGQRKWDSLASETDKTTNVSPQSQLGLVLRHWDEGHHVSVTILQLYSQTCCRKTRSVKRNPASGGDMYCWHYFYWVTSHCKGCRRSTCCCWFICDNTILKCPEIAIMFYENTVNML